MTEKTIFHLAANDIIADRPFTHPDFTKTDLSILHYMIARLCEVLEQPSLYSHLSGPAVLQRPEADGRSHRIVICDPMRLMTPMHMTIVGFFGQKKPNADPTILNTYGRKLIGELSRHKGLLGYCTLALNDEDYSNLVVFDGPEAKDFWGTSHIHAYVAGKPSHDYYASVRLYNGMVPAGLADVRTLRLERVKYYDFAAEPIWYAIRDLTDALYLIQD